MGDVSAASLAKTQDSKRTRNGGLLGFLTKFMPTNYNMVQQHLNIAHLFGLNQRLRCRQVSDVTAADISFNEQGLAPPQHQ